MNNSSYPVRIRPAVPGDIDVLTLLLELLFARERDFCFDAKRQRQGLTLMIGNPAGCLLVAETAAGEVVGMCSGQITISTAEGGLALLVEDVVVHPDRRSRGIGRLLLSSLREWAKERNISRMQLLADLHNHEAMGFYRKVGWRSTNLIALRTYTKDRR